MTENALIRYKIKHIRLCLKPNLNLRFIHPIWCYQDELETSSRSSSWMIQLVPFSAICCKKNHGKRWGSLKFCNTPLHDVIKWKHFPRYWPFVRGIHRSRVNFPHKGQWRGALMFSLICARINGWVNNREAGDLRRYHAHYDVIVMPGAVSIWRYRITSVLSL